MSHRRWFVVVDLQGLWPRIGAQFDSPSLRAWTKYPSQQ